MSINPTDSFGRAVGEDSLYLYDGVGAYAAVSPNNPLPITGGNGTGTMRVNSGYMAFGQSAKNYTGFTALSTIAATTIALETVTTGKTFLITDIYVSTDVAAQYRVRLQANGIDIAQGFVKGDTAPWVMQGLETQPIATSGQAVTLLFPTVGAATNAIYNIYGFEQ